MNKINNLNNVDVSSLFKGAPSLDKLYDALCKPDYTVDIGGVKIGVKGEYFAGSKATHIDPPEPSSFEIDEVFIGGVPCLGMFGEAGQDLLDLIEATVCERIEA